MNAEVVIKYFGNIRQTALKVGCTRNTVYAWKKSGIVPARWHEDVLKGMGLLDKDERERSDAPVKDL